MRELKILSIAVVKYIPIILSICILGAIIIHYWLPSIGLINIIWMIYYVCQLCAFLILSLTFKFCIYHRLIIYYLFLTFAILALDSMVVLPISVFTFKTILLTISGITLIAVIITYLKYGDRKISQKDKLTD